MTTKVAIALNSAWNLVNFRSGLIQALAAEGYEVIAIAPSDEYANHLQDLGCRYIPLPMDSTGTNLGRDLILMWRFYKILKAETPAALLCYTIKPNIYGSLVARSLGIPVINNIAGLGSTFNKQNWLAKLVKALYKGALSKSKRVFFQNEDDKRLFIDERLIPPSIAARIPGSGVDLSKFSRSEPHPRKSTQNNPEIRFILIARLLWEKGVGEFVDAAKIIKKQYPQCVFQLLGFIDNKNPSAVSRSQIVQWHKNGVIQHLGSSDDVRQQLQQADCVVLPSYYREGVPKTLLEAAAMSCPIITTDWTGCREAVDHGINGFLCKPRDSADLAEKMRDFIELTNESKLEMGKQGRIKVEREFDEQFVIGIYLREIQALIASDKIIH